jgi:hypothetical protein
MDEIMYADRVHFQQPSCQDEISSFFGLHLLQKGAYSLISNLMARTDKTDPNRKIGVECLQKKKKSSIDLN